MKGNQVNIPEPSLDFPSMFLAYGGERGGSNPFFLSCGFFKYSGGIINGNIN